MTTIALVDVNLFYVKLVNQALAPTPQHDQCFSNKLRQVTANSITADGRKILDLDDVKDRYPSGINMAQFNPRVLIDNTVYFGSKGGLKCGTAGVELVQDKNMAPMSRTALR